MLTPVFTTQFERDLKRMLKRGKDPEKFKAIARLLLSAAPLAPKYRDHKLRGPFIDRRDLHVENDWVLIYKKETTAIIFERTGTHADLLQMMPQHPFRPHES